MGPTIMNDTVATEEMSRHYVKAAKPTKDERKKGDTATTPVPNKPPALTGTTTSTGHVKRDERIRRPYLVSTVDGITQEEFEAFALQSPLGDKKGDIIASPYVPWVSCQYLDLSDVDAAIIRNNPIIAFVEPITEG
jgi:hypothetical protein